MRVLNFRRQRFFFEKNNQKTFANLSALYPQGPQPKESKVFCCFFSKKQSLLFCLLVPCFAWAHAMLEEAVPPVGSTVAAAPSELQLNFSESIEPRFTRVAVSGPGGAKVAVGALHVDPADDKRLLVPVAKLVPGIYTIVWHAVSVDTHRTQGTYHFTVAP
jgi:methionine-rich copper-binding protein CopC